MDIALGIGAIALAVVLFDRVAHRMGASSPLVLMVVGIAASFIPFIPDVQLKSEVVLLGLLPPLLYATAIRTSVVDFRLNIRVIGYLSVLLVVVTAGVVGLLAWLILPIPFAAAFALGAVIAPPDAVAATAVGRRVGLPRRLLAILEGESLVNDASAITCLRAAIVAIGGTTTAWSIGGSFLLALFGGAAVGLLVALIAIWVRKRITDTVVDTAISFILPWAAYLPAEEAHSSGVIAVVTAGLILGHKAPIVQTAQSRLSERTNWTTIQFLLENSVFLLIGLQAKSIVADVKHAGTPAATVIWFCAAMLATVIVVRLLWVMAGRFVLFRRVPGSEEVTRPPFSWSLIIGWAGMRGVVTLAAAFLLPEKTPHRELLILAALVVTAGTLLLQGLTLPVLVRRLGVLGPDPRQDALAAASVLETAGSASLAALDDVRDISPEARDQLQQRIRHRTDQIWEQLGRDASAETPSEEYRRLRLFTLGVERKQVLRMRTEGQVDQEVLGAVLSTLDIEESMLSAISRRADALDQDVIAEPVAPPECEHLERAAKDATPNADTCQQCIKEGTRPVHLRLCLHCGTVGCCDSSVGKHAAQHYETTGHPVMRSFEPGELWRWCYVDQQIG
ncbi:MAG: Na+/H+ antiporter [Actinomycetota bacterium]|nr:Na+/H+ antiporter [Actinomycetota bacterium]